jgi:hypothetical protein
MCVGEMLTAWTGTGWGTDEWHTRHNIPYVTANLIALKDPMPRNGGTCFW